MFKKISWIYYTIFFLVAAVVLFTLTLSYKQDRARQLYVTPPKVEKLFDISQLEKRTETAPDVVGLIAGGAIVPKSIEEVELMSQQEKVELGVNPNSIVQVLGRSEAGTPLAFRTIANVNGLAIDYSNSID